MKIKGLLMRIFTILLPLLFLISSCSSVLPVKTAINGNEDGVRYVSTTAANNMSLLRGRDSNERTCVRLGPDATFSEQERSGLTVKINGENFSDTETQAELIGRSIGIIGLRDIMFNLCLLNFNGIMSDEDYAKHFEKVYMKGFELLDTEIANEKITIIEKSAVNQSPVGSAINQSQGVTDSKSSSNACSPSNPANCEKNPSTSGTPSTTGDVIKCPDGVLRKSCGD